MFKRKLLKGSGNATQRRQYVRMVVRERTRMVMEDTVCGNGTFWCNHLYDPAQPWTWVDVTFLSTRAPKRYYFAAALTTLEYKQWCEDEDAGWTEAERQLGRYTGPGGEVVKAEVDPVYGQLFSYQEHPEGMEHFRKEREIADKVRAELNLKPRLVKPSIRVEFYRPGCYGVHASLNTPSLNDDVVRQFIQQFRDLGEPITEGIVWEGDFEEVCPENLNKRYAT